MLYNPRKEDVYRQLNNLSRAIKSDSFSLNRDDQCFLEMKLDEFKKLLDEKYGQR